MQILKSLGILSLCLLGLTLIANAAPSSLGISDVGHVTFNDPIRVGTTLLPPGDYEVRHVMRGQEHLMVFKQMHRNLPGVTVACKLAPLTEKATKTATVYQMNASNERVLIELVFNGDTAKHVF
jgi:hypothetical protein